MILPHNISKFGYYSVNGKIYLWKSEAIKAAGGRANVKFHFNEDTYDTVDWTKDPEPAVDLLELYKRRAQSIRDRYDYVVILYSGGPDSTNMLESFVNNSIYVDEIVNINSYARTNVSTGTVHNADYVNNVKPTLDLLQTIPGFKSRITILDEVEMMGKHLEFYKKQDDQVTLGAQLFHGGVGMHMVKPLWTRYVPHIWNKIINGEKICIALGADKPLLHLYNGRYGVSFGDLPQSSGFSYYDNDYQHVDIIEQFYQSAETTNIIIKQCHILKRFMDQHPTAENYQKWDDTKDYKPSYSCPSRHGYGDLRYDLYHKLIYPNWNPNFVTPKPRRNITRMMDNFWMRKLPKEETKMLDYVVEKFVKEFSQMTTSTVSLTQIAAPLKTKPYFIE